MASDASQGAGSHELRIQVINAALVSIGAVLALVAVVTLIWLFNARERSDSMHHHHLDCVQATHDLMVASDLLTTKCRMYATTGDDRYLQDYLTEFLGTRHRDHAVAVLEDEAQGTASQELRSALDNSNRLAEREVYAMRLVAEATGLQEMPETLATVELSEDVAALSRDEKRSLANEMLLGYEYEDLKTLIVTDVDECSRALDASLKTQESHYEHYERTLHLVLLAVTILLVALLAAAAVANYVLVMRPIQRHAYNIQANEPLDLVGAAELRYVSRSYNRIYEENLRRTMLLRHEAETDALTGLLNRGSFDRLLERHATDIALVIIDVDLFKDVNDTFGHVAGDDVLRRVGTSIKRHFRTTDYPCRIGGDEFAVILTEMPVEMRAVIASKLDVIRAEVSVADGDIPAVTLTAGVAFSVTAGSGTSIYHAADKALYEAKRQGRNRYVFFEAE